ncbi:MAG: hypothetical protein AAF633_04680, partial [Chloroflexota bacterium]
VPAADGLTGERVDGETANEAYQIARDVALNWQADAQLISASTTVEGFNSELDLYAGNGIWSFQFYSPTASAVSTVKVFDGEGSLLSGKRVEEALSAIDINTWLIDSNRAMSIAMETGGNEFYRQNGSIASIMQLAPNPDNGRMEWLAVLVNQNNGVVYQKKIDAMTGEIVPE